MDRSDEKLSERPFVEGLPEAVRELLRSQEGLDELTRFYLRLRRGDSVALENCERSASLLRFWRRCHLHLVEIGQGRELSNEFQVCKDEIENYLRELAS